MTDAPSLRTHLVEVAFDELPSQIAIVDADGVIRATNHAWETFGLENGAVGGDMVGENYLAVCRAAEDEVATRAADSIEAVIDGSTSSFSFEYPCHSPDEQRWFTMHARRFEFDGEALALIVHRDITDRYLAEQDVAERNETLELVAGILSHDLRNPLSVALGRIELLDDGEHVDTIERSLERMNDIIDDALLIARETEVEVLEDVDLGVCARDAWSHVTTDEATLRVSTDATVAADASLLTQLFENLFRNAVEHAGSDVTVSVDVRDDGFVVQDDGPGVPPEHRDRVFEAGFTTDADGGGTGLGLLIVREIAAAHGWEIELADTDGGATFVVSGVSVDE